MTIGGLNTKPTLASDTGGPISMWYFDSSRILVSAKLYSLCMVLAPNRN